MSEKMKKNYKIYYTENNWGGHTLVCITQEISFFIDFDMNGRDIGGGSYFGEPLEMDRYYSDKEDSSDAIAEFIDYIKVLNQ